MLKNTESIYSSHENCWIFEARSRFVSSRLVSSRLVSSRIYVQILHLVSSCLARRDLERFMVRRDLVFMTNLNPCLLTRSEETFSTQRKIHNWLEGFIICQIDFYSIVGFISILSLLKFWFKSKVKKILWHFFEKYSK